MKVVPVKPEEEYYRRWSLLIKKLFSALSDKKLCDLNIYSMERFHSRGHELCKFIRKKERFYIGKDFNCHRTCFLGHQHGRR